MQQRVSLGKCSSYNQDEVDASIKRLVDNIGGIGKFAKKGQKILLKPNIVKGVKPEKCATTHPSVVESVIKILNGLDCEIFVGDAPFAGSALKAMKISGIYDICKRYGAKAVSLNKKVKSSYGKGIVVKEFQVAQYFNEADAIINLPKLKTHSQLYFTGAVKNLYGIMPGPRKGFYHLKYPGMEYFANMLLDLYALLREKVVLNIMDGIYGMEGDGPCNGKAKFAGILGASDDAVALDFVMCGLAGLDIEKLPTADYAKKRGDYMFNPKNIKVVGEKAENIRIKPFAEAKYSTLNMMPKFISKFQDYIMRHKGEMAY